MKNNLRAVGIMAPTEVSIGWSPNSTYLQTNTKDISWHPLRFLLPFCYLHPKMLYNSPRPRRYPIPSAFSMLAPRCIFTHNHMLGLLPNGILFQMCELVSTLCMQQVFDASTLKTKLTMVVAQLIYTLITLIPVPALFSSYTFRFFTFLQSPLCVFKCVLKFWSPWYHSLAAAH